MPNYRVSYGFVKLSDNSLIGFTLNVETGLTGNTAFPTPPVAVSALATGREDFMAALDATHNGGPVQTVEKNDAREALLDLLRQDASYVQTRASKDLAALLSSGYNAVSTNRAPSPLPKAVIASLLNENPGMLVLNIQPMVNARSWEVQLKNGTGSFALFGVFGYTRRITIPALTPGEGYTVQLRAVGGSTGYSDWSDAVTRIVT
jgi:hypothetical protein